jgi:hypothetical protein
MIHKYTVAFHKKLHCSLLAIIVHAEESMQWKEVQVFDTNGSISVQDTGS